MKKYVNTLLGVINSYHRQYIVRNCFIASILLALPLAALPFNAFCAETKPAATAQNSPPVVVVTIKPIHSLVAAVMGELGKPELLINGKLSEHDYSFKPSDMKKLQSADIIFFTSLDLETFLIHAMPSLQDRTIAVELAASEGVTRQPVHDSDLEVDDANHGLYDPHIWLSPENAIAMVKQIKKILSLRDKKNRGIYEMNAKKYINKISKTSEKITLKLSPYKNIPFIVFHDAFGYFVKAYGLNQNAAISLTPESPLGAEKISDINALIKRKHIYCVFADPAFGVESFRKIINNPDRVKFGVLDPLGNNLENDENAYLAILDGVADNLLSCLADGNI